MDTYKIILKLNKDKRTANKEIQLIAKKPLLNLSSNGLLDTSLNSNNNSPSSGFYDLDITQLISIEQNSLSSYDLIF